MRSNNTIYSLHTSPDSSGLLHIETVVVGGIYNFSILGIPVRYSNDIKHKIYTALRAEAVLNLKSDNRKITCNLISDREDVTPTHSELAIALSCVCCLSRDVNIAPSIIVGAVSITGNIIPTHHILQAINLARNNNIKQIICGEEDIVSLKEEYIDYAFTLGIKFIVGTTIKEIVDNIRAHKFYSQQSVTKTTSVKHTELIPRILHELRSSHIEWSLFVALCGRHNILIETDHSPHIEDIIASIHHHFPTPSISHKLGLAHRSRLDDLLFQKRIDQYTCTKIPANTTRKIHKDLLAPFIFCENIISTNFNTIEAFYFDLHNHILSTCQYCPCGNIGSEIKKCLCLQRNIMRYQHKLDADHKNHYSMWVSHRVKHQNSFDWDDYGPIIQDVVLIIRSSNSQPQLETKAETALKKLGETISLSQKQSLIQVAHTLQVLSDLEQGKFDQIKRPTLISMKNLLLAFSYLPRMGL